MEIRMKCVSVSTELCGGEPVGKAKLVHTLGKPNMVTLEIGGFREPIPFEAGREYDLEISPALAVPQAGENAAQPTKERFSVGAVVRATHDPRRDHHYFPASRVHRARYHCRVGTIIAIKDAHGLAYEVRFEDDFLAVVVTYDHEELAEHYDHEGLAAQ